MVEYLGLVILMPAPYWLTANRLVVLCLYSVLCKPYILSYQWPGPEMRNRLRTTIMDSFLIRRHHDNFHVRS